MDVSSVYVKMCNCPEIQEYRKEAKQFEHGDLIANYEQYKKKKFVGVVMWEPKDQIVKRELATWLPRQSQIQEMIPKCNCSICLIENIHKFATDNIDGFYEFNIESMEQIWLAFYMWKKHGKIWGENGWEEVKDRDE